MLEAGAEAATDVTGFGLLGHLHEMLLASGVAATHRRRAPCRCIPGALDLARSGRRRRRHARNHEFVAPHVDWGDLDEPEQLVLADAQTSGGLLIATDDPTALDALVAAGARRRRSVDASRGRRSRHGRPARRRVRRSTRDRPGRAVGNNRPPGSICTCNRRGADASHEHITGGS